MNGALRGHNHLPGISNYAFSPGGLEGTQTSEAIQEQSWEADEM